MFQVIQKTDLKIIHDTNPLYAPISRWDGGIRGSPAATTDSL